MHMEVAHMTTENAFEILGILPSASHFQIKTAYRRAISRFHPDRLISRGAGENELKYATLKTQSIKAAYDKIRKDRGIYR